MQPLPTRTKKLIELSDEIVELNRKILEAAKAGLPVNKEDRERFTVLLHELQTFELSAEEPGVAEEQPSSLPDPASF